MRPRLLMDDEEIARIRFETLDVTDLERVKELVARHGVTHIVHLAGLQVPFCKANPALGARVNVVGTVNIFEAARAHWGQVRGLAYASSLAVMGPDHLYPQKPVRDDAPLHPQSLYGVYKQANEETARIYCDWGIPSAIAPLHRLRRGPRPGHDVGHCHDAGCGHGKLTTYASAAR